ncbi:DMT family transporter [Egibacter rhizosphaerae]|nr:DMT family transporter [Egibacter rhizosphaerae]
MSRIRSTLAGPGGGFAAVLGAMVAFSTGFPIVKGIDLPAASIAFWRLGLGIAVLGALAVAFRTPWPRRLGPVVGTGLAFVTHQLIFIEATKLTSIAVVTLVAAMQPLLVALVSRRTVGERVPLSLIAWSGVALAGVALVLMRTAGDDSRDPLGDVLAVVNLFAFTAYFLAAKRARTTGAPTLTFTASFLAVGLVVVTPFAFAAPTLVPATAFDVSWLVILALIPGNGHLLLNWAHQRVSAALASIALAGIPLLGSLWGHLFFGEPFGLVHVAGISLVAAAVVGSRVVEHRRTRESRAEPVAER